MCGGLSDMEKCATCNRVIMGKRYLGMCSRCFANFINILLIVLSVFVFPTAITVVTFVLVIPLWGLLMGLVGFGWVLAAVLTVIYIIALLVCLGWIVFLIVNLIVRNKRVC